MQQFKDNAATLRREELRRLRRLIGVGPGVEDGARSASPDDSFDDPSFDELVGGVGPRRLVDLIAARRGCAAGLVGLWLAERACWDGGRRRGELVVIDPAGSFYPPAAFAWRLDARRLVWVTPESQRDALAAAEIALRSPAVAAVWASLEQVDARAFRRLLLATEEGGAMGVLVRPGRFEAHRSWADAQLRVEPVASHGEPDAPLLARVVRRRNRHGPAGGEATLSLDWRTGKIDDVTHRYGRNHRRKPDPRRLAAGLAGAAESA